MGAINGATVVQTDGVGVYVLASEEKWIKAKGLLNELKEMMEKNNGEMSRKRLEQIRGFFIYVTPTYPGMVPYLIGIHMTIDGWRNNRQKYGWQLSRSFLRDRRAAEGDDEDVSYPDVEPPAVVWAVPRLRADIEALLRLMKGSKPRIRKYRCKMSAGVTYGFGDASGRGFGATFQVNGQILFEYGQWTTEDAENSSNWRELNNLVLALERLLKENKLRGSEIFVFTYNATAESAFWKGTSTSEMLFELVLRLRELELEYDLILHVVHVAGKRMIDQGADSLSRADNSVGVMKGIDIRRFVPLHQDALQRQDTLKKWLQDICADLKPIFLEPEDWFEQAHRYGNFIWTPRRPLQKRWWISWESGG
jgi:hypothetical protein